MEVGPTFRRGRAIVFSCIILVGLIWAVLLSVDLFLRWDLSDYTQRSLTLTFLLINAITVIMLPMLLLVQFRLWLDAARMLLLLFGHFGVAVAFSVGNAKFSCPDDTPDDYAACKVIDVYILLGSWVIPALLVFYCTCLGMLAYRLRQIQGFEEPKKRFDIEDAVNPVAVVPTLTVAQLPIMRQPPANDQRSSMSIYPPTEYSADRHVSFQMSRPLWLDADPTASRTAEDKDGSTAPKNNRHSARLSKRLPDMLF